VKRDIPAVSVFLALATLIASFTVAKFVSGSPLRTVRVLELRQYGGVNNEHLANGEWWRLLTAQFVHVTQAHMLFNVATLFLLAAAVERAAGSFRLALIWMLSGVVGTYASIRSVPPPYEIGSGASQVLMGIAAAAIIVMWRNQERPRWLKATLIGTLVVQIALDLVSAHYPKSGHVAGLLVGLILAVGRIHVSKMNKNGDWIKPRRIVREHTTKFVLT